VSAFSTYLANNLLDHVLGGGNYTRPANVHFALLTSAPTDENTGGVEVIGTGYARVQATNNSTNFPAAAGGKKTNGTAITFPIAGAEWGAVRAVAVFDSANGGNLLMHALLSQEVVVKSGNTPSWPIGALRFSLT
jgi:hypothetical protein